MDYPTQNHLATLRDLLAYRRHELQTEIHAAQQGQRTALEPAGREVSDQKDQATLLQMTALDDAQQRRDAEELAQVEAALHRLDAGTYGDCVECGEPIALSRLMVQPAALRCAACQSDRERESS